MRIFLTPSDVLFFRSARPFNAGEDDTAQSVFPPTPETIQGMLRALIASHWATSLAEAFAMNEVRELIGDRSSYGRFRLILVTLGHRRADGVVERLFPAPAHLQRETRKGASANEEARKAPPVLLWPKTVVEVGGAGGGVGAATNLPDGLPLLLAPEDSPEDSPEDASVDASVDASDESSGLTTLDPFDAWLTEDELAICLRDPARIAAIHGTPASDIYTLEPRTGIGLQPVSRTASEGLYYRTMVVRMKPSYGLVADFQLAAAVQSNGSSLPPDPISAAQALCETLRLPPEGLCQLGGERRVARYQTLPDPSAPRPDAGQQTQQAQRAYLYFASPACFSGGWRPASWEGMFGAAPVAAAIPRIERIGGWRLDPRSLGESSKALRRCVPAGSVYFFDQPITLPGPYSDYGHEIGYGYAFKGGW